jgi:hypothetical protein
MGRAARGWQRAWSGADARLSIEVARIAIAVAGLIAWGQTAQPSYQDFLARFPHGAYDALGVLRLLGDEAPAAGLLTACKWIGLVALIGMLVGAWTRVSIAVSLVANLVVVGVVESFNAPWSHGFVPLLLVHLAFVAAPAGRALSVDAWWRRGRGAATAQRPAPVWPVLLAQVAAALPFFNAVYWKLRVSGFHWVLSDNLRHQILTRFDWAGDERTALADFLVKSEVAWKAAAAANMVTQALPMVACLLVRRPRLRAALGVFYVVEIVLLDLVMQLPNYHWLPFALLFIDWDRLVAWRRRVPVEEDGPAPRRGASWFIAAFLVANLAIAFVWRGLDRHANLYPLSQYRMFAMTRAKPPYDVHQTWEWDGLRFRAHPKTEDRAEVEAYLAKRFRKRHKVRDPQVVRRVLLEARRARRVWKGTLSMDLAIQQAPPYPAEPSLVTHDIGVLGRFRGRRFQSLLGEAGQDADGRAFLAPHAVGLALPPDVRFGHVSGGDPTERPLEVQAEGGRYYFAPLEPGRHVFFAIIARQRFIVAQTGTAGATGLDDE